MQLFTYLVTEDTLVFQSGCMFNKIRHAISSALGFFFFKRITKCKFKVHKYMYKKLQSVKRRIY